jgi:ectoine hydrolase
MAHPYPAFTRAEYDRRIATTRAAMAEAGIDLLFVEDPSNMAWLTGYDGWSFYVHQGVIVIPRRRPAVVGPGAGCARGVAHGLDGARTGCWDMPTPTCSRPNATRCRTWPPICATVAGHRADRGRAGQLLLLGQGPSDADRRPARGDLIDATALVNWLRGVKSNEEIAFMRRAARISEVR